MQNLFGNLSNLQWQQIVMWAIGALLIYLAIKRKMEPSLLCDPKLMLFGAAAQFGIFFSLCLAVWLGFDLKDAASIAVIGAAGISAFPMSARTVNHMGLLEDNQNFLLMPAVGVNVSGQIASVIAGGIILTLFG